MQKLNSHFEVLIHDDASTDNTATIIREYEEKYPDIIKPIYQIENQYSKGVKISFVYQFSRARGKYIAVCEGDDYWTDPYKLQKQVDFMEANDDVSMCFHDTKILKGGKFIQKEEVYGGPFTGIKDKYFDSRELFERWMVPTASIMFRSKFLPAYHDPRIANGDLVLVLHEAQNGRVYGMADCMSVYRIHDGGLLKTMARDKVSYYKRLISHNEFIRETFCKVPRYVVSYRIASNWFSLFVFSRKDTGKVNLKYLLRSFLESPIFFFKEGLLIFFDKMRGK
jgi:glycosyltransferase involved in cell wall biosynthesis